MLSHSRSRRRHRLVAAVAVPALAASLAACASSDSQAGSGAALRVGFISPLPTPAGPAGWAQHRGALAPGLKSAGISSVRWVPFKNGPDLSAAISGGSLDMAILGDTPALTARAKGLDTHLVNQDTVGQDTWLFAKKGGATTIAQLKGKVVSTQVGSYMYRYLVALLDRQGLGKSVRITHIYTPNAIAALRSGGIAAYAAPAGQLTDAMRRAGFTLLDKASQDHRDLLGTGLTVITGKELKAHPKLPAAWNAVRAKSIANMTSNPDAYYAFAAKATGTTAAVVRQTLPVSLYPTAPFTPNGLKLLGGTNAFLATHQLEVKKVDVDQWQVTSSG